MDLREFLGYFDFDYDIVQPDGNGEERIRRELVEDGKLAVEDMGKDLICLVDLQGAYFGDIGKERFPIAADSAEKIVGRMDIYVQESVYDEFTEALEARDIDSSNLSLEEMIEKCRELGVDSGEVCYTLAEAVAKPESITIKEVVDMKKDKGKDVFAVGLARQLRDLMGDLIENNEGLWEDLSIRLPIVREGLDGYGMVIHAMEDDIMDQFFLVSVYEGFSEEDLGDEILHECTEFADLDELESVTRGLLSRIVAERDILTEVRDQIERNNEASVRLENGRSIQVDLETEYGAENGPYYIVQLVRNDAEAKYREYEGHQGNYVGAVYWCVTDEKSLEEVGRLVKKALDFNERRPVAEHSRMESLDAKICAAEGQKVEGVGKVAEKDLGER